MEKADQPQWDTTKYQELNTYFKLKIKELLETHPTLLKLTQENRMELQDIVNCMHLEDQIRWKEYMQLDQMKMQQDIQDHLEGKGTPFHPSAGFSSPDTEQDAGEHLW